MNTLPGFNAEASLGARTIATRGAWNGATVDGRVAPATIDCKHRCLLKLIDCNMAHETQCYPRYQRCLSWCNLPFPD